MVICSAPGTAVNHNDLGWCGIARKSSADRRFERCVRRTPAASVRRRGSGASSLN